MFKHSISVYSPQDDRTEEVEAWVDIGSTYTWLSGSLLRRLGVHPTGQRDFILANGTRTTQDIAQVRLQINGEPFYTYCVFGDEEASPLLGAVALEEAGLAIDPVNRRLISVPGYALTAV